MSPTVAAVNVDTLAHNWGAVLIRGILAILFGVITFVAPGMSLAVLVLLFGAYAFVDGVLAVVSAFRRRESDHWAMMLLEGLVGIGAGLVTLFWPGLTALALLYVIGAWAMVTGAFEIAAAIRLRKVLHDEWLLVLGGLASIGLGVLLFAYPGPGALALILWIGAYALVFGVLLVGLAFRLRSWDRVHPFGGHRQAPAPA
jgi:uncharacterized membrane protein HdeD (DUF308 family)